ncbi:hypothetical protein LMANV2_470095 [Leptospira interrogans serovar Manilae]|uniref:Uncharacterized protein n=1 Tax=Leptospira interrogans serovar Manilae TaxID=214675 RepID=A0AAQ1P053_LEPIR|nr:hypothetical protein LMANV2_470095 [Leptospira interrogans serovar Manilae]
MNSPSLFTLWKRSIEAVLLIAIFNNSNNNIIKEYNFHLFAFYDVLLGLYC